MRKAGAEVSVRKNSLLLQIEEVHSAWETVEGCGGRGQHPSDVARGQGNRLTQGHPCPEVFYQKKVSQKLADY